MRQNNGWEEERGCKAPSSSLEPEATAQPSSCISALTSKNWVKKYFFNPAALHIWPFLPNSRAKGYCIASILSTQQQLETSAPDQTQRMRSSIHLYQLTVTCVNAGGQCLPAAGDVSEGTCWGTLSWWKCHDPGILWEKHNGLAATRSFLTPPRPCGRGAGKNAKRMQLENWEQVLYELLLELIHTKTPMKQNPYKQRAVGSKSLIAHAEINRECLYQCL